MKNKTITYFISDGDNIKIGKTVYGNLYNRLSTLQTGNVKPLTIELVIFSDVEYAFHRHYERFRLNGEWFFLPTNYRNDVIQICNEKNWKFKTDFYKNMFSAYSLIKNIVTLERGIEDGMDRDLQDRL